MSHLVLTFLGFGFSCLALVELHEHECNVCYLVECKCYCPIIVIFILPSHRIYCNILESMREIAEFSDVIFWNMVHLIDIFVT